MKNRALGHLRIRIQQRFLTKFVGLLETEILDALCDKRTRAGRGKRVTLGAGREKNKKSPSLAINPPAPSHPHFSMTKRAKSLARKKIERSKLVSQYKLQAVDAYLEDKAEGGKRGTRQFSEKGLASKSTLARLAKGGRSIQEFNKSKKLLMPEEERTIVNALLDYADRGVPLDHQEAEELILNIIKARNPSFEKVGKNFVRRFLDEHAEELKTMWSSGLDDNRADAMNPKSHADYYNTLKRVIEKYAIPPENIYGFDETGIMLGVAVKRRVIGRAGAKLQYARRDGDRENITIVPFICGDGSVLTPTVIFKGKKMMKEWGRVNPLEFS